ncbi:MAG TPA: type IX secretion system membrane protein PorP/SprF [Bacteroidia bacterium]|nr:type IX secretion system membrane protein PorP/SprF [Bacteroidia bacterium]
MKSFLLLFVCILPFDAFACGEHVYRLSLNQRSYYNPASLCPYCKGSTFLASGFSGLPAAGGNGYFLAIGNDGENRLHGPWDLGMARAQAEGVVVSSYNIRYAWQQKIGKTLRMAAGMRFSYLNISQEFSVSENVQDKFRFSTPDFDGGVMITDRRGFYAGFSVQHLGAPQKSYSSPSGVRYEFGMKRNYVAMAGTVVPIGRTFDLVPDINMLYDGTGYVAQPGCLFRLGGIVGIGGGITISGEAKPLYEIRGGITTSTFKFLGSFAFTPVGIAFETGLAIRFGVEKWRVFSIADPCTGGSCTTTSKRKPRLKKKLGKPDEFRPHV